MARKLSVDDICGAIADIEENTRKALLADIVSDLRDFMKAGMTEGDQDTWLSGYNAAIEMVTSNY